MSASTNPIFSTAADETRRDLQPLADLPCGDKIDVEVYRHHTRRLSEATGIGEPHGVVGERCDQPSVRHATGITVRCRKTNSNLNNTLFVDTRKKRLPGIGYGALAKVRNETIGYLLHHPVASLSQPPAEQSNGACPTLSTADRLPRKRSGICGR